MKKTLLELYNELKESALGSELVEEVVLAKTVEQLTQVLDDLEYRSMIVVMDTAALYSEDDFVNVNLTVVDKVPEDSDEDFLYSVNDGISLFKTIADDLSYSQKNDVEIGQPLINSFAIGESVMTSVSVDFVFHVTYLRRIRK